MDPTLPTVRYYNARRIRLWHFIVAFVSVTAIGVAVWFGTDLLHNSSTANGLLDVNGELSEQPAQDDGSPTNTQVVAVPVVNDGLTLVTSVAIIGDSLTDGSEADIRAALADVDIDDIEIDGVTSRRIEQGNGRGTPLSGIRTLYTMLSNGSSPDLWVIALGTNDVGQYADDAEYRELIRTVLEMVPDDVALVWVDTFRADRLEESAQFNKVLLQEVSRRNNSVVAHWYEVASDERSAVLRDDGVHPNEHGRTVFAEVITQAITLLT